MATTLTKTAKDKGYHIRDFDAEARRMAKAGATLAAVPVGAWIAQAVQEKFNRDIPKKGGDHEG